MRTSPRRVAPVMMFSTVLLVIGCNKQEAAPLPPPVARVDAPAAANERAPDAGAPAPVLAKPASAVSIEAKSANAARAPESPVTPGVR